MKNLMIFNWCHKPYNLGWREYIISTATMIGIPLCKMLKHELLYGPSMLPLLYFNANHKVLAGAQGRHTREK
jgi:hypothetical protein